MDAVEIVEYTHALGADLVLGDDGRIGVPKDKLTPELRKLILGNMKELRAYLTSRPAGVSTSEPFEALMPPASVLTKDLKAEIRACKAENTLLSSPAPLDAERVKRDAWRRAAFELAELAGWPRLPYRTGHAVAPGEYCWRLFLAAHGIPDLQDVVTALRRYVAAIPAPGEEPAPEPCRCGEMSDWRGRELRP